MKTQEQSLSEVQGKKLPSEGAVAAGDVPPVIPMTIGIGASAGGHDALQALFSTLPVDTGFSFVVVMHLPQEGPSLLAGILKTYTKMQVRPIEDGMPLLANTVFVPPPGIHLTVSGGRFQLHQAEENTFPRNPIDGFFSSLATELAQRAVAVILSGYGTDGSEGARQVKERGGLVFAQDPQTAINPFMPLNAIKTGAVDWILSAREIAERLGQLSKDNLPFPPPTDDEFLALFSVLQDKTGHDFSSYKKNTVFRRIKRRMVLNALEQFGEYLEFMRNTEEEAANLCQELLIGVTNFFRDPEAFEILRNQVIPSLFAGHKADEPVRIWHACCATGEEAYSVAMLIREHLERENLQVKVQIFASDLDETAIAYARRGVYAKDIASDVGEARLQLFFTKSEEGWQVTKELREMIVFAHHNIIKDPPFSRLDLLVCRNFLIYLNPDIQKLLIPLFYQVLNPQGVLFLGSAETIGQHGDLFTPLDKRWKIFIRQKGNCQVEALFPFSGPVRNYIETAGYSNRSSDADKTATIALVDKLLMERYVPAWILINEKNEVIHFSSQAGNYLITPEGEPTRDLLRLVREELRPSLRAAAYKAFTTQNEIAYRGIRLQADHGITAINLIALPLGGAHISPKQALIIIEPVADSAIEVVPTAGAGFFGDESMGNALIRQLEEQLRVTSEQLLSTSEQLENSNERFMLANEELMTVNEELQSSNEELQSTNEELVTVNAELHRKMEELNQSNSDLENLLTSTGIAIFFLCPKLSIKRYSPAMADIFQLTPADIGRSIRHFDRIIDWSNLPLDAASVLEHLIPVEREVQSMADGRIFIMCTLPYKTTEGVIDGIVVTLVDITERKRAEAELYAIEKALREGDERLRFALETCHIGAWDLNLEDHTAYRSEEHSRIFGYPEMLPQWNLEIFINHILPEDRSEVQEAIQQGSKSGGGWSFECRIRRADDEVRWIWAAGRPNVDGLGNRRIAGIVQDITSRKEIEEENRKLLVAVQEERDKLSSLVGSMADEVWFADPRKHFTLANPSALQTFGVHNQSEIDIEQFAASLEVFRPDGSPRPIEEAPSLRALRGEVIKNLEEIIRIPTTGEMRHREVSANPVRDVKGTIVGAVAVVRDITDRKAAEETIRLYELLAKNSRDIILFIRREDGQILEANAAALEAYGYGHDELLGMNVVELRAVENMMLTEKQMAEADHKGILFETVHRRKDGTTFPVEVSSQGTEYRGTRILLSVIRDISERKQSEAAIQESRTKLEAALASMTDAVFISDSDGKFVNFNEAFATIHRFASKDDCLKSFTEYPDILDLFMEDGSPAPLEMWAIPRALRGETATNAIYGLRRKDTGESWIGSYSFAPIREKDGLIVGAVVVGRDITEMKRQEEELRLSEQRRTLALEAAKAGTWEWDLLTNENVWSNELWSLYGLEPNCCEPSYDQWRKTIHPDDLPAVERTIHEAVSQGVAFSAEWRVKLGDGAERWLMSRGKPVRDGNDRVVRYLGIVFDNTKQKRTDEETKTLHSQLAQGHKMEAIGTLAGGIAHDFNNMLGAIIGYAEMARDSCPEESDIASDLDNVLEAGERAANLVKQILAFSREASADRVPLEPASIVKETIKLLRPALPSTITIKQNLDAEPQSILADPTQIHQIIMNLSTNAYHSMEQSGGILEISLRNRQLSQEDVPAQSEISPGKFVELSVGDTGPGIPPEIQDKIFEPYFTTKEVGKGTGMGLSIIHGIVSSMDGFVICENKPEKGAIFRVFIPAVEKQAVTAAQLDVNVAAHGKERILLIDDEEILAEMGRIMLERLGYKVTIRSSSIDALSTFQNHPDQFDAVITDQTMPGITGFDLARRILQIRPDIPIILCTGYSNLITEEQVKKIGIKGFIMKPMSRKDISLLLREVLDRKISTNE